MGASPPRAERHFPPTQCGSGRSLGRPIDRVKESETARREHRVVTGRRSRIAWRAPWKTVGRRARERPLWNRNGCVIRRRLNVYWLLRKGTAPNTQHPGTHRLPSPGGVVGHVADLPTMILWMRSVGSASARDDTSPEHEPMTLPPGCHIGGCGRDPGDIRANHKYGICI